MTKEEFKAIFNKNTGVNGFNLDKDTFVFLEPLQIWNAKTDEATDFEDVDKLWDAIKEQLKDAKELTIALSGSTGAGGNSEFKFGHAKGNGKDKSEQLFPAYANTRIKSKTLEGAMEEFHERFKNENKEWAYEIDNQGYVHQYVKGNATSVGITGSNKNNMILHNHPSGGAFSDSDLISTSLGNERGIVASGKYGDYIFEKNGGHFKASEFVKAVKTAKMKGKDYDDAVKKWLTANQKKYGYKFKFVPDKTAKKSK